MWEWDHSGTSVILHCRSIVHLVGLFVWAQALVRISLPADTLSSAVMCFFYFAPIALKSSGVCSGQLWTQIYLECLVNKPQSKAKSQESFSWTGLRTQWQEGKAGVCPEQEQEQETTAAKDIDHLPADDYTQHKQLFWHCLFFYWGNLYCADNKCEFPHLI